MGDIMMSRINIRLWTFKAIILFYLEEIRFVVKVVPVMIGE